jgi:hypothetical protein
MPLPKEVRRVDPKPPPSAAPPPPIAAEPAELNNLPAACPICGEARENDAQFCQHCGHNFVSADGAPKTQGGLRGPLLWVIVVFWAVLAIAGLAWLYTGLYRL